MKIYRTAIGVLAGLLLSASSVSFAQTLPASQVGNIATNGTNLSSEFLTVNWADQWQNIGLVQFDLASLSAASVSSATLNLYHLWNSEPGAVFGLFQNTSSWSPAISSWSDVPTHLAKPVAELVIGDSADHVWRSVDVTQVVNSWVSGSSTNYGFTLQRLDQANPVVYFSSTAMNGGFAPTLSVVAVPEPETYAMLLAGLAVLGGAARRRKLSGA